MLYINTQLFGGTNINSGSLGSQEAEQHRKKMHRASQSGEKQERWRHSPRLTCFLTELLLPL